MNVFGFRTLLVKEIRRFWKVLVQTVLSPVVTAVLYLAVFGHVLGERMQVFPGVSYTAFIIPGLIMMSVIQNAFANTSSSLIQSKMMGNLVFLLMAPLSAWELFGAYVLAGILRGVLIGTVLYGFGWLVVPLPLHSWAAVLAMTVLAGGALAVLGLIAGILAEKFDHLAAFQNFFIMPASFLSGVFYSIHTLPEFWRGLSHYNPFFYMIDGFRWGFFGVGDATIAASLLWTGGFFALCSAIALWMLQTGYRLRP
ncbi:MAG: ABC transporter permease [Gammaproteobacteria bacterium]|nr:ABC transporter permease [Gammaproteobacteria bacterium]